MNSWTHLNCNSTSHDKSSDLAERHQGLLKSSVEFEDALSSGEQKEAQIGFLMKAQPSLPIPTLCLGGIFFQIRESMMGGKYRQIFSRCSGLCLKRWCRQQHNKSFYFHSSDICYIKGFTSAEVSAFINRIKKGRRGR